MIHHVVLFRWIPSATPEQVTAAGSALLDMKGRIPEIRSVAFGPNLADSRAEYTHALLVVVEPTNRSLGTAAQIATRGAMEVYQFTENGIALQATVSGTKYWQDSKLNK